MGGWLRFGERGSRSQDVPAALLWFVGPSSVSGLDLSSVREVLA